MAEQSVPQTRRPRIVCLCGSTRFKDVYDEANYHETMAGRIVLSVGFLMHATGNRHGESIGATPEQKAALDELHLRKIDLCDEVFVLNVGGYIGESTGREIAYAESLEKIIRYLEPGACDHGPFHVCPECIGDEADFGRRRFDKEGRLLCLWCERVATGDRDGCPACRDHSIAAEPGEGR